MRRLVRFLLFIGFIISLAAAVTAFSLAFRFQLVAGKAKPAPQPLTAAELIAKGPGDNLHVELTDFTFGKPVVQEREGLAPNIWIPIYPAGRSSSSVPSLVLHTEMLRDQARLEELLNLKTLRVLALTAQVKVLAVDPLPAQFFTDYPKLDPEKVTLLEEPSMILGGKRIFTADEWFNPQSRLCAWLATGGAFGMSCLFIVLWRRSRVQPGRGKRRAYDPMDLERLMERDPVAVHQCVFNTSSPRFVGQAVGFGTSAFLTVVGLLSAGSRNNSVGVKQMSFLAALLCGGIALVLGIRLLRDYLRPIKAVGLYRGGIRWERGKHLLTALWSDIERIWKVDIIHFVNGAKTGENHSATLELCDGTMLHFSRGSLEDYDNFIERVQSAHTGYLIGAKQREMAETGEADFGDFKVRRDGVSYDGTFIRWEDLGKFEVEEGYLILHAPKAFMFRNRKSIPLRNIPNYLALVNMLRPRAMSC